MFMEITEKPINPQEFIDQSTKPHNGGLAVFLGTVRELSDGRRIAYMEYDAYKEMAEKKLREICREAGRRWNTDDIVVAHRTGRLELTEASVIVAVGTPHRAEAFACCRYIIDTLKETLPIWKKEVDIEGKGEWMEGCVPSVREHAST